MRTILLTGAQGYLGGCILAEARRRGLDIRPLEGRLQAIAPRSLDADAVIHCAAARRDRPGDLDASNRLGTQRLLEGLKEGTRIVFVSSRSVYAPSTSPLVDENAPLGATDPYGVSKRAAERLVAGSGHPFLIFRASALFGTGAGGEGSAFPAEALRRFLRGRPVTLHHPDRLTDYLYVVTFGSFLLDALEKGGPWGEIFNAAGPPRSLHGLIRGLGKRVDQIPGLHATFEDRPGPPATFPMLSTTKLERQFGPLNQPDDGVIFQDMICGLGKESGIDSHQ